jgi:hypothetical protein
MRLDRQKGANTGGVGIGKEEWQSMKQNGTNHSKVPRSGSENLKNQVQTSPSIGLARNYRDLCVPEAAERGVEVPDKLDGFAATNAVLRGTSPAPTDSLLLLERNSPCIQASSLQECRKSERKVQGPPVEGATLSAQREWEFVRWGPVPLFLALQV